MLGSVLNLQRHADADSFYLSPSHEEALARLEWLITQRRRLGVVVGPSGSGKSLILAKLAAALAEDAAQAPVVKCSLLGLDEQQFLVELAQQLELNPRANLTTVELWRRVFDRLKERAYEQVSSVLLLDDAHTAGAAVLTAVSRLAEFHHPPDARLTIVLAADEGNVQRLGERLLARCALRIDVEPWDAADTLGFLQQAIAALQSIDGAPSTTPVPHFSPAALEKIHALSGGIPRRVGQLAEWALVAGAGLGLNEIDDETVAAAAEELGVTL
jgi:type II secretory pathway predicted ATPase ExeA